MVGSGFFGIFQRGWMSGKRRVNSNLRSITVRTPPCARPQAIPCISSLYHRIRNTKDQLASAFGSFGRKLFWIVAPHDGAE